MEMTNWNLKILNLTETTTSRTIVHEESQIVWLAATDYLEISGTVISLIGILLNYFCFITADKLPKSSSASLMKHAAFWDSVSAMNNGVVKMGLQQLGLDLDNLSVSTSTSFLTLKPLIFLWPIIAEKTNFTESFENNHFRKN